MTRFISFLILIFSLNQVSYSQNNLKELIGVFKNGDIQTLDKILTKNSYKLFSSKTFDNENKLTSIRENFFRTEYIWEINESQKDYSWVTYTVSLNKFDVLTISFDSTNVYNNLFKQILELKEFTQYYPAGFNLDPKHLMTFFYNQDLNISIDFDKYSFVEENKSQIVYSVTFRYKKFQE